MPLTPIESFSWGGLDSRSNPLNFPPGRSLRCRNWVVRDSGILELRNGFSTVTVTGSSSATAYHTIIPYTQFDNSGNETPYALLGQGTQLRALNIVTGVVTVPSVKGAALASTASFASYLGNGKIHFGNGTDQKWFDGTTVRSNGLRALTTTETANIVLAFGVGELTAAQNSTITLTTFAGGSFTATVGNGYLFYVSYFDTLTNELGPATTNAGSGRVTTVASNKVTLANLPNTSGIAGFGIVKLISRTGDSLADANFCTNTSTAVTSCTRSGSTISVISPSHGLTTGDVVVLSGTTNFDSVYVVNVVDANTLTIVLFLALGHNTTGSNTTGGTCKRVVSVAAATTTIDVLSPAVDTSITVNDANRGVLASAVSGSLTGYQFYASIYNPNGGGHVGNRIVIGGGRFTLNSASANRVNVRITGIPDLSGTDSEWSIMIGRTGDGAQIPYPCQDSNGNNFFTASGQTAITLTTQGALFGNSELPTRNGVIPSGLNMFCRVSDRIHGGQVGRPTVYRSATESDSLNGDFVGRPEQSWAPNDIDTFPTGQGLTGCFDEDRGAFYGTKNHGAIFADTGQGFAWIGPWYGAGMAGRFAWCDTSYGKYWVTGHKQLATMRNGNPVAVSDEYEASALGRIGDAFLSQVQMFHYVDVSKRINKIVIKCLDSNGVPFEVFHDFRIRDEQSPEGQCYDAVYSAPLSTNFVLAKVRDSAGAERLWAGASTGQIYQLETGANDAGTEFTADYIGLVNGGPKRPSLEEIQWYGDSNVTVSTGRKLNSTIDSSPAAATDMQNLADAPRVVDAADSLFAVNNKNSTINHLYIRFQLTSHSVDGNLNLNDPPHLPLENYGRVYLTRGLMGSEQGPR
jgi:hypothetical protein